MEREGRQKDKKLRRKKGGNKGIRNETEKE